MIICVSDKLAINLAASSSPVIPNTVPKSSAIVKELIAWLAGLLPKMRQSFKNLGSFSKSDILTLLLLDHSDSIDTIYKEKNVLIF